MREPRDLSKPSEDSILWGWVSLGVTGGGRQNATSWLLIRGLGSVMVLTARFPHEYCIEDTPGEWEACVQEKRA